MRGMAKNQRQAAIRQDATLSIRLYKEELQIIQRALTVTGKAMSQAVRENMLKWAHGILK